MACRVCGKKTRKTYGVHYIEDRWLLLEADYCNVHGSFISADALQNAIEVTPDPTKREHIRPGLHVNVYLKEHQAIQRPTEGFVSSILTKSFVHSRGIKVLLSSGKVGRIQEILK